MNTTTQPKAPVRADTSSFKSDALKPLSTPAENRSGEGISKEATETLKRKVKGQIVLPSDPSYDEVLEIWNAMIDRRPALIVRCAEAGDVPCAIWFARKNGLEISIRGGGHNIAGSALCDSGVMIDLSTMRRVHVDAEKKRAFAEPGARLADFDEAAQSHGLLPIVIATVLSGLNVQELFAAESATSGASIEQRIQELAPKLEDYVASGMRSTFPVSQSESLSATNWSTARDMACAVRAARPSTLRPSSKSVPPPRPSLPRP